jgi:signal transduction histidine kinase
MLISVIAIGVAVIFTSLFAMQVVQNRRLFRGLKTLNDEDRAQPVTMSFPTKSNEALTAEINRLIRAKSEQSWVYRANERRLREAISNISHDMRTPLTAILGYIRLINQGGLSAEERANCLRIVETRSRGLNRLIRDFYDLSLLDEDEYRFENAWIDVNQMCLELLAAAYDDLAALGISADVRLLPKAPKVFVDRDAVNRVYGNLLENVKKHGRDMLRVSSETENGALVVTFENGADFPEDREIDRVFERTYTSSGSRSDENTGLGLAICKTLLNKMGHGIAAAYHEGRFSIKIIWHLESEEIYNEQAKG